MIVPMKDCANRGEHPKLLISSCDPQKRHALCRHVSTRQHKILPNSSSSALGQLATGGQVWIWGFAKMGDPENRPPSSRIPLQ